MSDAILYIGEDEIKLDASRSVSVTVKSIDIGDLSARFVTHSNEVSAVINESNTEKLGFSNDENSRSSVPYFVQSGRLISPSGRPLIPNASIVVRKSNDNFKLSVFDSSRDFFQDIKGLTITDINPIPSSGWQAADIDSARLNTDGIVTALVHWGKSGALYQFDYFLPCFYYHTIIKSILEFTGLTLSGSILTDTRFTDLVIPYPGESFAYNDVFIDTVHAKGLTETVSPFAVTSTVTQKLNLNEVAYGTMIDLGNDQFVLDADIPAVTVTVTAYFNITNITYFTGTLLTAKIYQYSGGVETERATVLVASIPTASNAVTLTYTGMALGGDLFYGKLISDGILLPGITGDIEADSFLMVRCESTVPRDLVFWNNLWPSIKCEDLLKDFFTRFAIIPKIKDGVMHLKSIEEIISDRVNAVDWSNKKVTSRPDIDFNISYATENYFNYGKSDDVSLPELGRGSISINSDVIDKSKDIYTSIFGNTKTIPYFSTTDYLLATIPVYDSSSTGIETFAEKPGLRLLTLRDRGAAEAAITFDATPRTDYKVAYFVDPTQVKDTGFQYFIDQFYPSLSAALQLPKTVNKDFVLDEADINSYDPHKIIWCGVNFYLINTIRNFITGIQTIVNLFKVS